MRVERRQRVGLVADEDVVGDARPPLHDGRRRRDHSGPPTSTKSAAGSAPIHAGILPPPHAAAARPEGKPARFHCHSSLSLTAAAFAAASGGTVPSSPSSSTVRTQYAAFHNHAFLEHLASAAEPKPLGASSGVVVAVLRGGVLGVERRFALELVVVVHPCRYFVRRCSCMQHKRAIRVGVERRYRHKTAAMMSASQYACRDYEASLPSLSERGHCS